MTKVEHLYQEVLKREIIRYKDIKEITAPIMKIHKISTR